MAPAIYKSPIGRITWYASFASSGTDTYTVTVLDDPPDPAAAQALVRYLLGTSASANLRSAGLRELAKYVVVGTGVPEGLQKLLGQ